MRRSLRLVVLFLLLGLALLALVVSLLHRANLMLMDQGVKLQTLQGVSWTRGGLELASISGQYQHAAGLLDFQIHGLNLKPGLNSAYGLQRLEVRQVLLSWDPDAVSSAVSQVQPESNPPASEPNRTPADWLAMLPQQIRLPNVSLEIPCQDKRCKLDLAFDLERDAADLSSLDASLRADQGQLDLVTRLQRLGSGWDLNALLEVDNQPALVLEADWHQSGLSQGEVRIDDWPQAPWLKDLIGLWVLLPGGDLLTFPEGAQASLNWQASNPQSLISLQDWLSGQVQLTAALNLPEPWQLPDLGLLQGRVDLSLEGDNGQWLLRNGLADLALSDLQLPWPETLPVGLRPQQLTLLVSPEPGSLLDWQNQLSARLELAATGPLVVNLTGRVSLQTAPEWQLDWTELLLQLRAPQLQQAGFRVRELLLQAPMQGSLNARQLNVEMAQTAYLGNAELQAPELELGVEHLRLGLAGLRLLLPLEADQPADLRGQLALGIGQIRHPVLKPQGWSGSGALSLSEGGLNWQGGLSNSTGLQFDVQLKQPPEQPWQAAITLPEIFLRAANPLASTLADWPDLLSFSSGRLQGQFTVKGNPGLQQLDGQISLSGGQGIYDRTVFKGLSASLQVGLRGQNLRLQLPSLSLAELDPGLPLGPLQAAVDYQTTLDRLMTGSLMLNSGQLGMLGGQVAVQPARLELGQPRTDLVLELQGVELARLFEVYPAEGLSGRGTLDGRLPVTLLEGKLLVEDGQFQAREPGGYLQYRSDKLQDLAQANPGMRQVADALDDFHYTLLASDVAYDEQGILVLGMQLQGRNPNLQGGRPIHLNLRLEEDIPALMASLQLSGQVSEIIQKRVQQRLIERQLTP